VKQQLTITAGRRPLDEDTFQHLLAAAHHNVRRAAGELISPDLARESSFASTSPAEGIVLNLLSEIQAAAPEAKSPPRDRWTDILRATVIALALLLVLTVGYLGWQQAKYRARVASHTSQAKPKDTGDPQVWVDFHKGLYYCSGDRHYGKTKDGQFTTLHYARISQYQPASPIVCQ
jgi:hypothetical protein